MAPRASSSTGDCSNNELAVAANAPKKHLIVDFDGTCTVSDTTSSLRLIASAHAQDDDEARAQRMKQYAIHEQDYFDQYAQAKDSIMGTMAASEHRTIDASLDTTLDALDDVSTIITQQVSQSSCLAGLPQDGTAMRKFLDDSNHDIRQALQLRDDCVQAISDAHINHWRLAVLSINWCRPLIDAVLIHPIEESLQQRASVLTATTSAFEHVWCNDIDQHGKVTLNVSGAIAKREYITALRNNQGYVVYVGDSSTDLLALLEADVGILIGDSASAIAMAEQWGIQMVQLQNRPASGVQQADTLWTTTSWTKIDELLKESPASPTQRTPLPLTKLEKSETIQMSTTKRQRLESN